MTVPQRRRRSSHLRLKFIASRGIQDSDVSHLKVVDHKDQVDLHW